MSVTAGPTPTREQACSLLRGFLLANMPKGFDAVIAQGNRIPEAAGPDYAVITWIGLTRLATTVDTWDTSPLPAPAPTTMNHQQSVMATIQLDIHGAGSTDNVNVITTLLRSTYACQFFEGSGITPLFCDDGQQIAFESGEAQFEDRWVLKPAFEMSVDVATTQQFADTVQLNVGPPADTLPVA